MFVARSASFSDVRSRVKRISQDEGVVSRLAEEIMKARLGIRGVCGVCVYRGGRGECREIKGTSCDEEEKTRQRVEEPPREPQALQTAAHHTQSGPLPQRKGGKARLAGTVPSRQGRTTSSQGQIEKDSTSACAVQRGLRGREMTGHVGLSAGRHRLQAAQVANARSTRVFHPMLIPQSAWTAAVLRREGEAMRRHFSLNIQRHT